MLMIQRTTTIRQIKDRSEMTDIVSMVEDFIKRAKEREHTIDSVIELMMDVQSRGGAAWIIRKGSKAIGYFFCEIVMNEQSREACLVHELMIAPRHQGAKLLQSIDAVIGAWAKLRDAKEIVFYTRRDPNAFVRLIKNGWKLDSWIIKRCV